MSPDALVYVAGHAGLVGSALVRRLKHHGFTNLLTRTHAELDLRVGGRYHIVFHTRDGEDHDVSGVYQEVDAPRRLVFSWAWKSTPERVSRVSIDLHAVDGGTELRFRHDRFFDLEARDNHERGWLPTFVKLDALLAA